MQQKKLTGAEILLDVMLEEKNLKDKKETVKVFDK